MCRFNCISLAKLLIIIVKNILFICHYVYNHAFYTILSVCFMDTHYHRRTEMARTTMTKERIGKSKDPFKGLQLITFLKKYHLH